MMPYLAKIGDRVVAVRDTNEQVVNIYGHGQYVADEIPSKAAAERNNFALICRGLDRINPRVALDGDKGDVYGCECWWGPESGFETFVAGRKVEIVPLDPPIPDLMEGIDAAHGRD